MILEKNSKYNKKFAKHLKNNIYSGIRAPSRSSDGLCPSGPHIKKRWYISGDNDFSTYVLLNDDIKYKNFMLEIEKEVTKEKLISLVCFLEKDVYEIMYNLFKNKGSNEILHVFGNIDKPVDIIKAIKKFIIRYENKEINDINKSLVDIVNEVQIMFWMNPSDEELKDLVSFNGNWLSIILEIIVLKYLM
jgi:hypothetical protein